MFLSVVFHGRILFCFLVLNGVSGFLLTPSRSPPTLTSGLPSLAEPPVRIASFNIQVFGHTKYSKDEVRQALVKVSKMNLVCLFIYESVFSPSFFLLSLLKFKPSSMTVVTSLVVTLNVSVYFIVCSD